MASYWDPELPEEVLSAVRSGDLKKLRDIYRTDISLYEVACEAARRNQPQILEWCYSQGWAPPPESFNDRFFVAATAGASPAIFQVLVDHGFNLNAHDTELFGDALSIAVSDGHYDLAEWLLEHGHRVTPEGSYYRQPLVDTVSGDHVSIQMLKLLLDHGIDPKGDGAAVAAADEGNFEGLKLLLDYGVDVEERDMYWYPFDNDRDEPSESRGTALYRACRQGHLDYIKLLLDRGANPQAKDDGGTSCMAIAKLRGHHDVVKLLQERGVVE